MPVYPRIGLFGVLRISQGGTPLALHLSGTTEDLLGYLLTRAGRPTRRDRLADLFWGESDSSRSRSALNTAIWRINRALKPLAGVRLTSTADTVQLEADDQVELDIRILEAAVREGLGTGQGQPIPPETRAALVRAVGLYAGPFLEGSASEWALVERERLLALYLRGLALLLHEAASRREYDTALEYGQLILVTDPFREQVQRQVMWLYVLTGQRARALITYRRYQNLLADELGIRPMAETQALAEVIQGEDEVRAPAELQSFRGGGERLAGVMAAAEQARVATFQALFTQQA